MRLYKVTYLTAERHMERHGFYSLDMKFGVIFSLHELRPFLSGICTLDGKIINLHLTYSCFENYLMIKSLVFNNRPNGPVLLTRFLSYIPI